MIDYKKAYYYIICLIAFFVLLWGTIDLRSAGVSYISNKHYNVPDEKDSRVLDEYYQRKMVKERFGDSLIRILIAGGIFVYSRKKAEKA